MPHRSTKWRLTGSYIQLAKISSQKWHASASFLKISLIIRMYRNLCQFTESTPILANSACFFRNKQNCNCKKLSLTNSLLLLASSLSLTANQLNTLLFMLVITRFIKLKSLLEKWIRRKAQNKEGTLLGFNREK